MDKKSIITGCSSFNEANWKGVFYPEDLPRKAWFEYYCRFFNTYEMNGTFYKFPTEKTLANWYTKAPEGFRFSVKMYKGVTHYRKFVDCARELSGFYEVCRNQLREKLGCILFQLPPSFHYSEARLQLLLDALDYSFTNAVEFRHSSWWQESVYEAFRKKGIVFCNVSYPAMPETLVATADTGYVRLHGVPKLFYSGYADATLHQLHHDLLEQHWEKAFVYFNNTASVEGIRNALSFDNL
ncbi:DUF72 domain-containing protein [Flavobacterium magnum]|uniref:DUF72 domain-containing protein n=1 Tax=Flavobacterium magnum TaxID=2162713 RepID=A0A2S0RF03_9FLAO|nr:DUF72 domain-containing protein [Flavobacterium magnum]AWA30343.1 DUF72 domain-containing protein [Flavobacterium magnum]